MSSCYLTGGGRAAYRLESLNLDCMKSPSSTSWTSSNSASSSNLSESTNSPPSLLAISRRKLRTPRKRPNQTYNEAAAILSTAYPKIFDTKHLKEPRSKKLVKSHENIHKNSKKSPFPFEPSDLVISPFSQVIDSSGFLLNPPPWLEQTRLPKGTNLFDKPCLSPGEIASQGQCCSEICNNKYYEEEEENFDTESIVLDEETWQGIDSIMRNTNVENESLDNPNYTHNNNTMQIENYAYGYPVELGYEFNYGMTMMRSHEFSAIRRNVDDDGDWWRSHSAVINVVDLTPKIQCDDRTKSLVETKKKKKKKKKVEKKKEKTLSELIKDNKPILNKVQTKDNEDFIMAIDEKPIIEEDDVAQQLLPISTEERLLLKLNYVEVLNTWADKASPFSGDFESAGNNVQARLAQIDLFCENGGIREASVLRCKEKRRTRLFSNKIRYQVRKVNADRRPRMKKGRFVRTPNSS